MSNPIEIAIKKFENHPSVQIIKEHICVEREFDFEQVSIDDILKEMKNLYNKKNGTFKNIPSNRLKEVSEVTAPCLTNIWNTQTISEHTFPDNLKPADVPPVFKKEDSNLTKNYRPLKILKGTFKNKSYHILISSYQNSYVVIGCSTQTALISMLEKWRKALDIKGYAGAILIGF